MQIAIKQKFGKWEKSLNILKQIIDAATNRRVMGSMEEQMRDQLGLNL